MPTSLPIFYDCANCPAYCCAYPRIQVDPEDIRRLAEHFAVDEETARRRFTKKGLDPGEVVLRHHRDPVYGTVCRFLHRGERRCTVYQARPGSCRDYPGSRSCAYYALLMAERRRQKRPDFIVRAYNVTDR